MSYDPTIAQPFTSGCVFWLGMDESNNYVNLITDTVLTNNNVDNSNPTYTFDDNPSVPVFNNTNRVGAYIRSGFSFDGTADYSITLYVKNPTIDSVYDDEMVLSNTNKYDGVGEINIGYHSRYPGQDRDRIDRDQLYLE